MRKQYLEELLIKTKQQEVYIFNDDYVGYIELLDDRQVLIEAIEKINQEEGNVFSKEEKSIVLEIKELDEKNRVEYYKQLEEAKSELRKLNELERREIKYINPYGDSFSSGLHFDKGGR